MVLHIQWSAVECCTQWYTEWTDERSSCIAMTDSARCNSSVIFTLIPPPCPHPPLATGRLQQTLKRAHKHVSRFVSMHPLKCLVLAKHLEKFMLLERELAQSFALLHGGEYLVHQVRWFVAMSAVHTCNHQQQQCKLRHNPVFTLLSSTASRLDHPG